MEDPTRIYAIPTSAFSIPRYAQGLNGTQSRANLVDINSRGSIFKKRDFQKKLTALLIFIVCFLLLGIFILTAYYVRSYNALQYSKRVCITDECLRSASNLKLSMDESIDPCDDFYEFSCGHWSNEHPNHGWYPKFSTFETIDERIVISTLAFLKSNESSAEPYPVKASRYFYQSCMDPDSTDKLGYTVIFKYLEEVGLPLVPHFLTAKDEDEDIKFDWIQISVNLKKIFAMNLFIQFDVDADIFNRSNNVLYVGSGISSAPLPSPFKKKKSVKKKWRRSQEEESEDSEDIIAKMEEGSKKAMQEIIRVVVANASETPDPAILEKAVNVIWNMSVDIAEMASVNQTTDIESLDLKKFSVDELQKLTDDFLVTNGADKMDIWKPYITLLFKGTENTFDFSNDYLFIDPSEIPYLCNILLYISKTSNIILELYNWWIVVKSMIINTTSEISEYVFKETSAYYSDAPEVLRSRSMDCAQLVTGFMGIAISYGIVDQTFVTNTKPKVEQMLEDIKHAFEHRVNGIAWMDEVTKRATLEKSKEMISFIGFPEWLLNKTAIEVYYENITLSPTTYLENMMSFIKTYTTSSLNAFRLENEKTWRTDPTTVNAFNYFGDNTINVPMAILTFPIYHLGLEVLNYGAIGSILGHELTHGFDNTGRRFDKYGNLKEWWTNETQETFIEKSSCFITQYNNYEVPSIDMSVDGELTLGENLADNGGLHHAFLAYQNYLKQNGPEDRLPGFDNYSENQMFFIAYGSIWCESRDDTSIADQIQNDEHSPGKFRVLGTLQNSPDFAAAFNCPLGSKMNPVRDRCRIW